MQDLDKDYKEDIVDHDPSLETAALDLETA